MRRTTSAVFALALFAVGSALAARDGEPDTRLAEPCGATQPNGHTPPGAPPYERNHGVGSLMVGLWLEEQMNDGRFVRPDGSVQLKIGWWRGRAGELSISGNRLDGDAPALIASTSPEAYPETGFLPSLLNFPSQGCWKVTGTLNDDTVTFVFSIGVGRETWRLPTAEMLAPRSVPRAVLLRWRGDRPTYDVRIRRGLTPWRVLPERTTGRSDRFAPRRCGTYYARVRASDLFGTGQWSSARKFVVSRRAIDCSG